MVEPFGRRRSRTEIGRRTGHTDGAERGVRVLEIASGVGLRLRVPVDAARRGIAMLHAPPAGFAARPEAGS
jgi:hypothetical protein